MPPNGLKLVKLRVLQRLTTIPSIVYSVLLLQHAHSCQFQLSFSTPCFQLAN